MANTSRKIYMKEGSLSTEVTTVARNEITIENDKKVNSLAKHMFNRLSDLEIDYSITKRRCEQNDAESEDKKAEMSYSYEMVYERHEDTKDEHNYVSLTIMPNMFRIRTSNSARLQQTSNLYVELLPELERVHGLYYANRIAHALDDAMTKVGNARKYLIDGYLEQEEEEVQNNVAQGNLQNMANALSKAMKSTRSYISENDDYQEEVGI